MYYHWFKHEVLGTQANNTNKFITVVMALTSLSVAFSSSAYLTPAALVAKDLRTSEEVRCTTFLRSYHIFTYTSGNYRW